jgi:hypothetical protein
VLLYIFVKEGGVAFGNDPDMSYRVVEICRQNTTKPIITKLSPNQTDTFGGFTDSMWDIAKAWLKCCALETDCTHIFIGKALNTGIFFAKAKDKAGDSVFFKLFLALALNSESEKSIIKTEYSAVGTRITL